MEEKDIRSYYRRLIEHEDNLINHRMSWFGVFQGALVAGFLKVACDSCTCDSISYYATFVSAYAVKGICVIGILLSASFASIFRIGHKRLKEIKHQYSRHSDLRTPLPTQKDEKKLITDELRYWATPWGMMPIVFILVWIIVLTSSLISKMV